MEKIKRKFGDGRELVAEIFENGDISEINVYVESRTKEKIIQDICSVRGTSNNEVDCFVWGDAEDSDYSTSFSIKPKMEMEKAMAKYKIYTVRELAEYYTE